MSCSDTIGDVATTADDDGDHPANIMMTTTTSTTPNDEMKEARRKLTELIENAPRELIDGLAGSGSRKGKPSPEDIRVQLDFKRRVKELLKTIGKNHQNGGDTDNGDDEKWSYNRVIRTLRERASEGRTTKTKKNPKVETTNAAAARDKENDVDDEVKRKFMLGAVVGDVCGSTYEKRNCKNEDRVRLFRKGSKCTDDSVLTLATARRFLTNEEDQTSDAVSALYIRCYQEAGRKHSRCGYGGHFREWVRSPNPRPYNSWGNGSAMRVSPVAWAVPSNLDEDEGLRWVLREAASSAAVTHDHPEGIKGAQAVAAAVFWARRGRSKEEIRTLATTEFGYDLDRTLDEIRPDYSFDVSCQGSVPEALVAFLESRDFRDAVVKAVSLGGDSDTIACVAGAVAHAYYGTIPEDMVRATRALMSPDHLETLDAFWTRYRGNLPTHDRNDDGDDHRSRAVREVRRPEVPLIDVGINITNGALFRNWRDVVRRAVDAGVGTMILTGTDLPRSENCLRIAREWNNDSNGDRGGSDLCFSSDRTKTLLSTVGVHPHDAGTFDDRTVAEMRRLLEADNDDGTIVAVGECGLDYDRMLAPKEVQLRAFRDQVRLAHDLRGRYPLFVHERNAHVDLLRVLDEVRAERRGSKGEQQQPPPQQENEPNIVIHCFTGTRDESAEYVKRGYYIGLTGFLCKPERGRNLRETVLPELPLDRILVETDAPWMSFRVPSSSSSSSSFDGGSGASSRRRQRRHSEPADLVHVVGTLSDVVDKDYQEVCRVVTENTRRFFGLDRRFEESSSRSLFAIDRVVTEPFAENASVV